MRVRLRPVRLKRDRLNFVAAKNPLQLKIAQLKQLKTTQLKQLKIAQLKRVADF